MKKMNEEQRKLAESEIGLAKQIAIRYARKNRHITVDDAYAAALEGLCMAAISFDKSKKTSFRTYAGIRVKFFIIDHIRDLNGRRAGHKRPETGRVLSLDTVYGENGQYTDNKPQSILQPISNEPPADSGITREDFWREHLRGLSRNERLIMLMLYRDGRTMKEIGRHIHLSESRVSQLHSAIIDRIRIKQGKRAQ